MDDEIACLAFRIITPCGPLLLAITGGYRGIKIQGIIVKSKVFEKPPMKVTENLLICLHGKFIKMPHKRFMTCHLFPAKHFLDSLVKTASLPHIDIC